MDAITTFFTSAVNGVTSVNTLSNRVYYLGVELRGSVNTDVVTVVPANDN